MGVVNLIEPDIWLKEKFIDMIKDYNNHKENTFNSDYFNGNFDFEAYIKDHHDMSNGVCLPEGYVPSTEWWLINDNNNIIGTIRLRHRLAEKNHLEGGHIGYDISPSYRGKGYGKILLKLALDKAKGFGMEKVLITCDFDNIGSKKIIEHNGGNLENIIISKETSKEVLRYWIRL